MKKSILFFAIAAFLSVISCRNSSEGTKDLLNSTGLRGWKIAGSAENFKMEEGKLFCSGGESCLFLKSGNYRNFVLEAEVFTEPGASAGILFHTQFNGKGIPSKGYEIKIGNSSGPVKSGSITGIRNLYYPFIADNEWFKITVSVVENHVEVFLNNIKVNDYIQPESPWRSESGRGRLVGKGSIAILSGGNGAKAIFRG